MSGLTSNLFSELYLRKIPSSQKPILQVLGIQKDQSSKNNQFIIRLSDGLAYVDAVYYPKINVDWTEGELYLKEGVKVARFDLVSIDQYEIRMNLHSICKLKLFLKRISFVRQIHKKIGRPEEITELADNEKWGNDQTNAIKLQQPFEVEAAQDPIGNRSSIKQLYDSTMTVGAILKENKCDIIARVMRKKIKTQKKNGKDFTILVFHIVDKQGGIMKCEAIGKEALNNQSKIKVGKIYRIEGLEVSYNNYLQLYFLRFGKEYEITEVESPFIEGLFLTEKYYFEDSFPEDSKGKFLMMDLIGTVISIDEPKEFTKSTGDIRKVTRLRIYSNKKVISVSFWGENSQSLENELLIVDEPVILTDVSKKGQFYEFNGDSTLIRINSDPKILERNPHFKQLIEIQPVPSENNSNENHTAKAISIKQCHKIEYGKQNRQIVYTYGYITKLSDSNLYYSTCKQCSVRVKNLDTFCPECNSNHFIYKYAALIGISDRNQFIEGMAFGDFLITVLGKTAAEMNEVHRNKGLEEYLNSKCNSEDYLFGLDFMKEKSGKNKIVIKSIEKSQRVQMRTLENLEKIMEYLGNTKKE